MAEILIHDGNWRQHLTSQQGHAKGLKPRNYATHPQGYLAVAPAFNIPLIPESEWQSRLDAQIAAKAQLSDIRNIGNFGAAIPSRDQNGKGYCWFHSGVSAQLVMRAKMGLPYADLSAYAGACIIKNYRDEGGWGAEGVEWEGENGCPTSQFWPQQSMDPSNDTPAMRANAKLHRYTNWLDLDPSNVKAQLVTCLLMGFAVVTDFNWWGHSVCTLDLVSLSPFTTRIWNSWADSWSENGTGLLQGSKAIPDGAVAALDMVASES